MITAMFNDGLKKELGYYLNLSQDKVIETSYFYKHTVYLTRDNKYVIKKSNGEFLIYTVEEWLDRKLRMNAVEKEYANKID